jgi:hypothetical protein
MIFSALLSLSLFLLPFAGAFFFYTHRTQRKYFIQINSPKGHSIGIRLLNPSPLANTKVRQQER